MTQTETRGMLMEEHDTQEEIKWISLDVAASELGVVRGSIYNYVKTLKLKTKKFPLDRKTYISVKDLERIKTAKEEAKEGKR